jgi:hypothetical protein
MYQLPSFLGECPIKWQEECSFCLRNDWTHFLERVGGKSLSEYAKHAEHTGNFSASNYIKGITTLGSTWQSYFQLPQIQQKSCLQA